jgi:hippurate hydrolase
MKGAVLGISNEVLALGDDLKHWRRDIHANPELGFEEHRTANMVEELLRSFGLDVYPGIGKTGVVGALRVGNSPRSVGLRADMDALPIEELNDFAHRSSSPGVMHACGHDGHTAMLLGAAKRLAETRNFDGQVYFIFQPAEEGIGGAKAMIEDGLFDQFPCDCIFGMHNRPKLPVGHFAVRRGPMMAGGAFFDIDIQGNGSHGARPEVGVDPVVVGSQLVSAIQSIASRNVRPVDTVVISITQFHSGDAYNVIPHRARLSGTVRAFSMEVMALVEARMEALANGIAASYGASATLDFRNIFRPTINNVDEADYAAGICASIVGSDNVMRDPPLIMASEDFSFMLEQVPGCYINIGNGEGEGSCEVHNPHYDFNDEAAPFGTEFYVRLIEDRLKKESD